MCFFCWCHNIALLYCRKIIKTVANFSWDTNIYYKLSTFPRITGPAGPVLLSEKNVLNPWKKLYLFQYLELDQYVLNFTPSRKYRTSRSSFINREKYSKNQEIQYNFYSDLQLDRDHRTTRWTSLGIREKPPEYVDLSKSSDQYNGGLNEWTPRDPSVEFLSVVLRTRVLEVLVPHPGIYLNECGVDVLDRHLHLCLEFSFVFLLTCGNKIIQLGTNKNLQCSQKESAFSLHQSAHFSAFQWYPSLIALSLKCTDYTLPWSHSTLYSHLVNNSHCSVVHTAPTLQCSNVLTLQRSCSALKYCTAMTLPMHCRCSAFRPGTNQN